MKIDEIKFHRGFSFLKNGKGPTYVTLHTGPQFGLPRFRDTNSDTIASLCWLKTGGTLITSTVSRQRQIGLDLNRSVPRKEAALKNWKKAFERDSKEFVDYMAIYSWVAKDEDDYKKRLSLYNDFWNAVKAQESPYFLIHMEDVRIGNYPSLMDFISFDGKGIEKEKLKEIINQLNKKFHKRFIQIEKPYKERLFFGHRMEIDNMCRSPNTYAEWMKRDLSVMRKYAKPKVYRLVKEKMTKKRYLDGVKSVLSKDIHPCLTIEQNFTGAKAYAPKKEIIGKGTVVEIEINNFLAKFYPKLAREIIIEFSKVASK